jgi:hypothetical protein
VCLVVLSWIEYQRYLSRVVLCVRGDDDISSLNGRKWMGFIGCLKISVF